MGGPHVARCLALGALVALVLSGCDGSGSAEQAPAQLGPQIGVPLRLADCSDWETASAEERLGTVRALREFAGSPTGSPSGHGALLDDEVAYKHLDSYCANDFARGFKLYKLYTRAAAFQSLGQ